ncbi:hypothetical protein C8J57DRAFT_754172 [Mycena rebaudengoi]|nr:hypothetical protein C8J57DRAFT_754172 [Mycena rebaudengoi]
MDHDNQPVPSTSKLPLQPETVESSTAAVIAFLSAKLDLDEKRREKQEKHDEHPSREALVALGIRVRDFAYESTLPPIPPFRRQQIQPGAETQQVQPGGEPRKRDRVVFDGGEPDADDPFVAKKPRRGLGRTPTEAVLEVDTDTGSGSRPSVASSRLRRTQEQEPGYDDLRRANVRKAVDVLLGGSQPTDASQSQGYWQEYSQSQSQQYSQDDDEPLIATPLVTPNGSLQWGDDGPPVVRAHTPAIDTTTGPEQRPTTPTLSTTSALTRTLSSLSSPLSEPPSSLIFPPPAITSSLPAASTSTSASIPASPGPARTTRYQLRKRPPTATPPTSPTPPKRAAAASPAQPKRGSPYARAKRPVPRREESLSVVIQS